jgi:hypothetical protein
MARTPDTDLSRRYNRDEDQKPPTAEGRPPRHATEPEGAEASSRSPETATDPQTGETNRPKGGKAS